VPGIYGRRVPPNIPNKPSLSMLLSSGPVMDNLPEPFHHRTFLASWHDAFNIYSGSKGIAEFMRSK